jgi:hypothetical protein
VEEGSVVAVLVAVMLEDLGVAVTSVAAPVVVSAELLISAALALVRRT